MRSLLLASSAGIAIISLAIAFMMTGAGHGWITPFWFSFAGFITFPLGFWALASLKQPRDPTLYGGLLVLALASDVLLYIMTANEGWQYFELVTPFNYLWLSIWSIWQLSVLYAFVVSYRKNSV